MNQFWNQKWISSYLDTNIKHRCSPEEIIWVNAHTGHSFVAAFYAPSCALLKLQSLNCVGALWKPWVTACPLKDPGIKWFPHYDLCFYTLNRLHLSPFIHHQLKFTRQPFLASTLHTPRSVSAYSLFTTSCRLCLWLSTVYILFDLNRNLNLS